MFEPIALICLLCVTALLVGASVKRIPEGHVYTLHRLGRPRPRLLQPGTRLVVPLLERVRHKISLTGRTLPLDAATDAGTAPHGTVYWQVLDPEQADACIDDAEGLIRRGVLQALAEADAEETDGPARNQRVKQVLNAQLRQHGMLVIRVDLHHA